MSVSTKSNSSAPQKKPFVRGLLWTIRILFVFALLAALLAVLYWWGYHSYREVAEWAEPGSHEAFVYEGETYYLAGKASQKGVAKPKYPVDKILGQVRDDGSPVVTEPETTAEPEAETLPPDPEDAETDETDPPVESVIPPAGAALFENEKYVYVLYSVEKKEDLLIVLERDGEYYLYYREGTENPLAEK